MNVEGSRPQYSFHHIGTDEELFVFESPIDLLSYITLHPESWQEHSYVSLCGTGGQAMHCFWINVRTYILCIWHWITTKLDGEPHSDSLEN